MALREPDYIQDKLNVVTLIDEQQEGSGLANKRVVIMGLGRFGGGVGVARYMANHGARVLVTDLLPDNQLRESLAKLAHLPIEFRLGQHRVDDFTDAELIVVNPAVNRHDNQFLEAASAAGIPQTTEMCLTIQSLPNRCRTIAITGTAGKSTVTAMIGHMLSRAVGKERVFIGGNFGGSLLDHLPAITSDCWIVLELSSFMLEELDARCWSPHIAVVTNLWANHLDRHGTLQSYAAAKQVILKHQSQEDHVVLGPGLEGLFSARAEHVHVIAAPPSPSISLTIPGQHNQLNGAMALQATMCTGVDRHQATDALASFEGLPHRMQFIGQFDKIGYYNDSKATTPEAAQLAITSFATCQPAHPVHVIVGGYDKGTDLIPFGRFAGEHCQGIYTIGNTGNAIADAATGRSAQVVRCETLNRAVEEACAAAQENSVVLLSPGCASWDQFKNYEQRGDRFKELVLKRQEGPEARRYEGTKGLGSGTT